MAYFEWADDMLIDNGLIDRDHRHLVDLVNELHTATSEGLGQTVVDDVLKRLFDYTRQHFENEERIMAQVQFPHLVKHRANHQAFIESLVALREKYEAGSISAASQLSTLLRDWLSLHIRRADRELRAYVGKPGPGARTK